MDEILIPLVLLLLGGKKRTGNVRAGDPSVKRAYDDKTAPDVDAEGDGLALLARAEQEDATKWAALFADRPVSPLTALALARWAGIESSGNARVISSLDERGLMQAGPQTVEEGGMSAADWARLTDPTTTNKEHVDISARYVDWLWQRAAQHIHDPPQDPIDQVWYAKLYHQWPVDVRDGRMHGPAVEMARELAERWKDDAKRMHRLRAANVVAFGDPTP